MGNLGFITCALDIHQHCRLSPPGGSASGGALKLASASLDNTVRVWELTEVHGAVSVRMLAVLEGHRGMVKGEGPIRTIQLAPPIDTRN